MLELIQVLIWIIDSIDRSIRKARNRRELAEAGLDPDALGLPDNVDAAVFKAQMRTEVEARTRGLLETADAARRVMEQATSLERDLLAVPSGRLLRDLYADRVRPALEQGATELREVADRVPGLQLSQAAALLADRERVVPTWVGLRWAVLRAQALIALREARGDPAAAHRLADAEAIATSMLAPLQAFAPGHGVRLVTARPIATPAMPGGEAIWMGLLPEHHPILFVPADFEADLYRYASVPHELGHLLWRDVQGLGEEAVGAMGLQPAGGLLALRDGRLTGTLDQLFYAWAPELFADAAAILLQGPAALRGLCHSFAAPERPGSVLQAHVSERAEAYDEHPPAHARVHLAAHLLWTMGYDQQATSLRTAWDAQHGNPEHLVLPLAGRRFARLPAELILERGRGVVEALYAHEFRSVGGFRLADMPGFELGPGTWARVLRRADQLAEDVPFNDEGRVVLAAAIEARARHPQRIAVIARGLRRAILGEDSGDRRVADAAYARRAGTPASGLAEELRQALILREVLLRRPASGGPRGWRASPR